MPNASITLKIRGEEAENFVPEKLYSSHKYYVTHTVRNVYHHTDQLTARLVVEDPMTNQEVLSKEGKIIVKHINSTLEPVLAYNDVHDALVGEMRMQFTSSSYKFGKGYFRMRFSYFNAAGEQLFSLQSPPFRVYARKTSTDTQTLAPGKKKVSGKRKRKDKKRADSASPSKPAKKVKKEKEQENNADDDDTYQPPAAVVHHQQEQHADELQPQAHQPEQVNWLAQQQQHQQSMSMPHITQTAQDVALKGPDVISQPNSILTTDATSQTHLFSQFQEKLHHLMAIHQHIKQPDHQERARVETLGKLYSLSPQAVESALTNSSSSNHSNHSMGEHNGNSNGSNSSMPRVQIPSRPNYPTSFHNAAQMLQQQQQQQIMAHQMHHHGQPQQQQQQPDFSQHNSGNNMYAHQHSHQQHQQHGSTHQMLSTQADSSQQHAQQHHHNLGQYQEQQHVQQPSHFQLPPLSQQPTNSLLTNSQKDQRDLVLADPRPLFLAEAQKGASFKSSFSPLISTPKLLDENLKLKTPTDELLRNVKSPDKFEGFDTGTIITPSIVTTPSDFFAKDLSSPSVFSDPGK